MWQRVRKLTEGDLAPPGFAAECLAFAVRYILALEVIIICMFLTVLAQPTDKSKISDYGTPEKFLESFSYLLGKQAFSGERMGAL